MISRTEVGPQIPVIFLFHGALFAMTLTISVFQTQFFLRVAASALNKKICKQTWRGSKHVKAEYREDARKDIGSLVIQEQGHPVSDLQDMCGDPNLFSCPRIKTCKDKFLPRLTRWKALVEWYFTVWFIRQDKALLDKMARWQWKDISEKLE